MRPFLKRSTEPRFVREEPRSGEVPSFVHPGWRSEFPWLVQGITGAPFDLRLFEEARRDAALGRWEQLRADLELSSIVHSRQVHGTETLVHDTASPGLRITPAADGHLTTRPDLVLTVSVADCVPIFLVEPKTRIIGLLHAGWRGAAAGILPSALTLMAERWGMGLACLRVHLGPAICGGCYEVGPEVHRALGLPEPARPESVDLRGVLAKQALQAGVPVTGLSVSSHCTRCHPADFFSHRAGSVGRQMAFLGMTEGGARV